MLDQRGLIQMLKQVVGNRHVLTTASKTERFCKGFRSGEGEALAVVRPATLLELWQVLELCVKADKIIIMQAANTGLTEGSTPKGNYDRDVVLINTLRLKEIQILDSGKQIISFPGATLFSLEKILKPFKRQPHSVIGSSCIGASIIGGVCNNSGGSLVERGPSYTELSLFAQINAGGQLELVNHLGINLGSSPTEILTRLQQGGYTTADLIETNKKASASDYAERVRDVEAQTPARFNADKNRLYESSGCAGKLVVFAVRLDTYPVNNDEQVFYIGSNRCEDLSQLRRDILTTYKTLPVSAEYMHREAFDVADVYGKDTILMIDKLGTDRLPMMFSIKGAIDARLSNINCLPKNLIDRILQNIATLLPDLIPKRLRDWRSRFEHHLILKTHDQGIAEASSHLTEFFANKEGEFFICSESEGRIAGLHRFAAAGAAVRYQAVHDDKVEDILALDIALKRNDQDWFETLPSHLSEQIEHRLYYGHFLCHVLHQDYIVKKGTDVAALKKAMLEILNQRGAEYPAEHNVGHLYTAKPDLADFYQSIDPTNSLNPGIGKLSKKKHYQKDQPGLDKALYSSAGIIAREQTIGQ